MGVLKLTREQINNIKNNKFTEFPNGSIKIIERKNKTFLIIDLQRLYKCSSCTKVQYLDIIEQYESLGYTYYSTCIPYLYFYKKHNIFTKLYKFFK